MTATTERELLPRNLYFDAVDRQLYTEGLATKVIPSEVGRRHKLLQTSIKDAEQLIAAFRSAYHFDRPGNIELVLPQIADTLDDLTKHARNFIADVETSAERYRRVNRSINLADGDPAEPADTAVEPDPMAPAAPAEASSPASAIADGKTIPAPKPGPGLVNIAVFDPAKSPAAQLFELDRAIGARR
ncbi:hypothetical protein [Arthrobacter silvisoli]|uniref:hypothetical protein n=1 Tax=Arthrobacter silvisoli TaxID=2291022 RepID=UPI000E2138C1|nr:hypothetical protein [Arthrobacter silvisoli]